MRVCAKISRDRTPLKMGAKVNLGNPRSRLEREATQQRKTAAGSHSGKPQRSDRLGSGTVAAKLLSFARH